MKRFTHRFLPLALCLSLTLGAFAYRPPQAEAVAGVDDAIVIGALLTAFAGGCGLIFSNNGMISREIADGMAQKWYEFNESAQSGAETFAGWLGYEDMDALLADCKMKAGGALEIPRAMARKFANFTEWFVNNMGVDADGTKKPVVSVPSVASRLARQTAAKLKEMMGADYDFYSKEPYYNAYFASFFWGFSSCEYILLSSDAPFDVKYETKNDGFPQSGAYILLSKAGQDVSARGFMSSDTEGWSIGTTFRPKSNNLYIQVGDSEVLSAEKDSDFSVGTTVNASDFSHLSGKFGDAAKDDTASLPAISGLGDGTASTIEELLQQILEQVQANTLSPTLTVDGTQTGGNTGTETDEDAKPYLPYIPQIFEKIKDIPGTLSNIWETIKGIPAAIAEKIGAFFTTLWGWLSDIITEIKALPAAIAEAVGALFKPDEALVTEITDTFKGKFGFLSTLNSFVTDLFGMSAETEPPVIWVHLEDAESKYGYVYGDKQKMLDLSWYQKYKASVDGLLSGFLWLGYLWLLFKRAPGILNGMSMEGGLLPPLQTGGDVSDAPRIGSGNPSMHYGDGFTFRDKGGRRR